MAPKTFKNLVIAVSGTFPGYKQVDLKSIIEGSGAKFSNAVGEDCTHLVITQKEVDKNGTKYQQASKSKDCQIVSLDWLIDSSAAKKPLVEKDYGFGAGSSSGSGTNGTVNGSKANGKAAAKADTKKRTSDVDVDGAGPSKKQKDAQKASSKKLKVPLDEDFYPEPGFTDPEVYIDDSGLIWDATLNQTVSSNNANKFYRIQLLVGGGRYLTWTRWGRVGERGQSARLGNGALAGAQKEFEKKFKDKSGLTWANRLDTPKDKKYTFIERNYEDDDDEDSKEDTQIKKPKVESALPPAIQKLMTFIFNKDHFISTMASMSYDAQKLPLGKLSDRTLKEGFRILKELSDLVATPVLASSRYGASFNAATGILSDRYFTTIPHIFGRNSPPVLNTENQIKREIELLEALTDMEAANDIMNDSKDADKMHELDRQFQGLGMQEMTPLDAKSTEFKELETYLNQSRGSTHNLRYSVVNIFRIERQGETDRFMSSPYAKLKNSDRRLLWHGSRSTNFGGILSQGLRIAPPEAPVNGYMFGKGVYFADISSKSANYCNPYNSANMGLLLLCDVELGDPMLEQDSCNYNAAEDARKGGKYTTLGRGQTIPGGWKDAGCVNSELRGVKMPDMAHPITNRKTNPGQSYFGLQYNEYIAYDIAQIRQRYLFQVHMS